MADSNVRPVARRRQVERGLALHVIAGQLGHSSTATTEHLANLMPSDRIKAMPAAGCALDAEPAA